MAFLLTRPFGAILGDMLTKPHEKGGLDFGTLGSSAVLLSVLMCFVVMAMGYNHQHSAAKEGRLTAERALAIHGCGSSLPEGYPQAGPQSHMQIFKRYLATQVLRDLLYDGQPQTGTLVTATAVKALE